MVVDAASRPGCVGFLSSGCGQYLCSDFAALRVGKSTESMSDVMPSNHDVCSRVFTPPEDIQQRAHCSSMEQYRKMYARSVDDPASFWSEVAGQFYWKEPPQKDSFLEYNFDPNVDAVKIRWMQGAVTNVCYNVLDRHVANGLGDKVAFFW